MKDLKKKISSFPEKTGVYLIRNQTGKVIYVGKAVNIKKRVSSYFKRGRDERYQIEPLMKAANDIEYIVTGTEKEALLLEYNLIREHKPKYNVTFKDSKKYISIKFGMKHPYPGIYATRQTPNDGSRYFGPYTSAVTCRGIVDMLVRYFKIRICSDTFFANRIRPCIQYEIQRCSAPCVGYVTTKEYVKQIDAAINFLNGNIKKVIDNLKKDMKSASENLDYEEAARLRDVIKNIEPMLESQAISSYRASNKDYISLCQKNMAATFAILKLRAGKIRDYQTVHLKDQVGDSKSLWEEFLIQYYKKTENIPPEIIVDFENPKIKLVSDLLTEKADKSVKIRYPRRGVNLKRLKIARENAKEGFRQKYDAEDWHRIREVLAKKFILSSLPSAIECVDISNISGKFPVGSIVSFENGKKNPEGYRHYKIKLKESPDDYAMMKEVIERRFRNKEEFDKKNYPDIFLVDGGKGQMMIAKSILNKLSIKDIRVAAIAKGRDRKKDEIFISNRKNPVKFRNNDPAYLFLKRIRDEAHRFGIVYYRKRHRKELIRSKLEEIAGVGHSIRKSLFEKFNSIDDIKNASEEEIAEVRGISRRLAKRILRELNK